MLRSAAKNNDFVALFDPADYSVSLIGMRVHDGATQRASRQLALKVLLTAAAYDGAIAAYLYSVVEAGAK